MKLGAIRRLRRAVRRVRNRFVARGLILLYHRIAVLPSDPHILCVTPEHFAQHLEVLRKRYHVVPLKYLAQALLDGNLPRRAVAVTFDDGYADNLYNAKPLLERYDIPATVFVTTGQIDQEREFWWDELERLLLQPGELPQTLQLRVNGSPRRWQLTGAAHYDEQTYRLHRSWNVERSGPGPRQRLFCDLYQMLYALPPREQQHVLDQLWQWTGVGRISRPTHRTLASDELVDLADGRLVEVGAHTVTHSVLSAISGAAQRDEIQGSKAHLENVLGHPVTSFAYPYGLRSTYTNETVAAVREASFACACSNFVSLVSGDTDRFQLPRFAVQDWDGNMFACLLGEWLGE